MIRRICKICGNMIPTFKSAETAKCKNCGTLQTMPSFRDARDLQRYTEINQLRQHLEFTNASTRLVPLLARYPQDSELYWQRLLCRCGIVYVKETETAAYGIKCLLPQEMKLTEQEDYRLAIQYATEKQRKIYEEQAVALAQECRKPKISEEVTPFIDEGFQLLEKGQWGQAVDVFDKALVEMPHLAVAYLGKMMAELRVHKQEGLLQKADLMETVPSYALLVKYADPFMLENVMSYKKKMKYLQAQEARKNVKSVDELYGIITMLSEILPYPDAERLIGICKKEIQQIQLSQSEVLIGCQEANALAPPSEETNRIVVAKYYYESDTKEEEKKAQQKEALAHTQRTRKKMLAGAIAGLFVLTACAGLVLFRMLMEADTDIPSPTEPPDASVTTISPAVSGTTERTPSSVSAEERIMERNLYAIGQNTYGINGTGHLIRYWGGMWDNEFSEAVKQIDTVQKILLVNRETEHLFVLDTAGRLYEIFVTEEETQVSCLQETLGILSDVSFYENAGRQYLFLHPAEKHSMIVQLTGNGKQLYTLEKRVYMEVPSAEAERPLYTSAMYNIADAFLYQELDGETYLLLKTECYAENAEISYTVLYQEENGAWTLLTPTFTEMIPQEADAEAEETEN